MPFLIVLLVLLAIALVILISNIAIVPQAYVYVLERMGVYFGTWTAGFHMKVPFIDRVAKKVSDVYKRQGQYPFRFAPQCWQKAAPSASSWPHTGQFIIQPPFLFLTFYNRCV